MDVSSVNQQAVRNDRPTKQADEAQRAPKEKAPVKSEAATAHAPVQKQPVINTQGHVTGRKLNVSA
ncbi:hypothetical protein [Rhodoferax aquaticus]|uniref:Uncharacterized protein n=1 Tax=Rhodoferax aquaticus TaxID=2527691 RepID=A0A515EQI5_9BURK|nr:hypothetical protein [Rhodoferax aquaticus]QDL54917.1 hypothetical protein EXZ61_12505 [Rhodoferax aquaticus]